LLRLAPIVARLPATTPFVGPERIMRDRGLDRLVRLGANESAFGPAPSAIAAMASELDRTAWYGDPDSLDLRDALAQKHACTPDHIVVGSGIDDLIGLAVRAFVAPGAVAVTSRGTYPTFDYHVAGYGAEIARVPYRADGRPDLDGLAAAAHAAAAAMVYLANPDNPSGTFVAPEAIARLRTQLPSQTMLLLDEAYADFVEPSELLPNAFDPTLLRARTFSKTYGMAGARIGYALAHPDVVAVFQKIRLHYGVNRNAQIGALASLRDDAFRDFVVRETAIGRAEYEALASELGFTSVPSRTNFVCIDVGDAARAAGMVAALLDAGVWIRKPGAPPLDRCIRVSVGTAPMRAAFAAAFRDVVAKVPV
jgi:histidinol-phosphate aminotransferase